MAGLGVPVTVGVGVGVPVQETVKTFDPVVPPPGAGVYTDTYRFPIVAMAEAAIDAFSWVDEM
jgi:hypothetical protein